MKIGFIDYYLDEWHANNLPTWLRDETNGDITVAYAYGKIDSPVEGSKTNAEWAKKQGVELLGSIEEVVEKSDALVVLAPSFPEMHEELCDAALRSGKPTYVDKTFAPDAESAARMIQKAQQHNTPMFSTSALRFAPELKPIDHSNIRMIGMRGPGPYGMYSIHQIEPIVSLMGATPEQVMFIGTPEQPGLVIRFSDNRWATTQHFDWECPFNLSVNYSDGKASAYVTECTDFFPHFVKELADFFRTGDMKAPYDQTVAVIAIRAAGFEAMKNPGEWVKIPPLPQV